MSGYWSLVPRFEYGTMAFGPYEWRWITVNRSTTTNGGNVLTWTQS